MKNTIKPLSCSMLVALLGSGLACQSSASAANLAGTDVKFSGYIKVDAMYSDYSNGEGIGPGRDIYVPSLVQTGAQDDNLGGRFDAHAKQSRFRFTTNTPVNDTNSVTGVIEFDFLLTSGGNERVSNSYVPRLRHAFLKYNNWMVGQTWSTIMDLGSLVDSVDFIGTTDDNSVPDLVVTYTMKTGWGHVKVGGLLRQLAYETNENEYSDTSASISVSSRINIGNGDDIRIQLASGAGIGRYVGVNAANGAFLDDAGNFEAIDATALTVAYRHVWNENARSNIIYSSLDVDTVEGMVASRTNDVYSMRLNYIYSINKALSTGIEYTYAKRETVDGYDGDMNRLQVMAKYTF